MSARKIVILSLVSAFIIAFGVGFISSRSQRSTTIPNVISATDFKSYDTTTSQIGDTKYRLAIALTPAQQELGLGQRAGLSAGSGMVFVYTKPQQLCFWMKDMRFPIDIIWLNGSKTVTLIEPSLSPSSYPKTYCPPGQAQYVVEIPAGDSIKTGLKVGNKIDLQL